MIHKEINLVEKEPEIMRRGEDTLDSKFKKVLHVFDCKTLLCTLQREDLQEYG